MNEDKKIEIKKEETKESAIKSKPEAKKPVFDSLKASEHIKTLKARAQENRIVGCAREVAMILGKKDGDNYTWELGDIVINYDDYGKNMTIQQTRQRVLSLHLGELETYRPDLPYWEDQILNTHASSVMIILLSNQHAIRDKQLQEHISHWGIIPSDSILTPKGPLLGKTLKPEEKPKMSTLPLKTEKKW